ncbi:MAG: hypothetical protein GY795_31435 [Desulfobacterales bacterium]|nr:hypothetical protein [Desulfobacterales bacterium]
MSTKRKEAGSFEFELLSFFNRVKTQMRGYRSPKSKNIESFYFYLLRELRIHGYSPGAGTWNLKWEKIILKERLLNKILKAISARIVRHQKGSESAIITLENTDNGDDEVVDFPSLAHLPILFLFMCRNLLSDLDILRIFRGDQYIANLQKVGGSTELMKLLKKPGTEQGVEDETDQEPD